MALRRSRPSAGRRAEGAAPPLRSWTKGSPAARMGREPGRRRPARRERRRNGRDPLALPANAVPGAGTGRCHLATPLPGAGTGSGLPLRPVPAPGPPGGPRCSPFPAPGRPRASSFGASRPGGARSGIRWRTKAGRGGAKGRNYQALRKPALSSTIHPPAFSSGRVGFEPTLLHSRAHRQGKATRHRPQVPASDWKLGPPLDPPV